MAYRHQENVPSATEPVLNAGGIFDADWISALPPAVVMPGTLYVVSTPIGDPEDITIRALRILQSVAVVAAENPAVTRAILRRYRIDTPVAGFRDRKSGAPVAALVERLRGGDAIALVSDAGTPMVADAGSELARAALASGMSLVAVPGPAAALAALVLTGSASARFAFDGFPPRRSADRLAFFTSLRAEPRTVLLYETRAYLRDTLKRLRDALGADRAVLVARDLTKLSETLFYGTLAEAPDWFQNPPSGEFVLVLYGTRGLPKEITGSIGKIAPDEE